MQDNVKGFLKWIIGTQEKFEPLKDIGSDYLINLLLEHKLLMLFDYKIKEKNNEIDTSELFNKAFIEQYLVQIEATNKTISKQLKLIKDINRKLQGVGFPIKGLSPYLLCHKEKYLHNSGDVDFVCANFDDLEDYFKELGGNRIEQSLSKHEKAIFNIGDIIVEEHIGFPILNLPKEATHEASCGKPLSIEYLDYKLMASNISWCSEIQGFLPNYSLTALLICLHIYKDYYWEPYNMPRVKLGDLYCFHELVNEKEFDCSDFLHLIQEVNAIQAVRFVNNLVDSFWHERSYEKLMVKDVILQKTANSPYGSYIAVGDNWEDLPFWNLDDIVKALHWKKETIPGFISSENCKTYRINQNDNPMKLSVRTAIFDEWIELVMEIESEKEIHDAFIFLNDDFGDLVFENKIVVKKFGFFSDIECNRIRFMDAGASIQYSLPHKMKYVSIVFAAECINTDGSIEQAVIGGHFHIC